MPKNNVKPEYSGHSTRETCRQARDQLSVVKLQGIVTVMHHNCYYCGEVREDTTTCDLCDLQVTMCPDHAMVHRRFGQCLPFRVASMPGVGRCAVASRDIQPGEVILEDEAVMVAPGGGQRLCLECGSPCLEAKCSKCHLPLCCEQGNCTRKLFSQSPQ